MKTKLIKLLLGISTCAFLSSCAPTMYLDTAGDVTSPIDKLQPHFIAPPPKNWPIEMRNLYPVVVKAFIDNGVNITNNLRTATFAVDWSSQDSSSQMNGYDYMPQTSYTSGTVSGDYGSADYSGTITTDSYVPYSYTYFMKTFRIDVYRVGSLNAPLSEWTKVWTGRATAGAMDVHDPGEVIKSIVARYGTNSQGFREIGAASSH